MSIPEAAQLVMQAGCMGKGGEIFVLDMGEPVKIVDLARDLIRLSGLSEDDIKIEFSGLRPGEKLYEEVLADNEHTLPTPHPKLRIAQARQVEAVELQKMLDWVNTDTANTDEVVRERLQFWVPEYTPDIERTLIMSSLSVILITKNEAANIRDCLQSVAWADEIIVVDSGSTDDTAGIAKEMGAQVIRAYRLARLWPAKESRAELCQQRLGVLDRRGRARDTRAAR